MKRTASLALVGIMLLECLSVSAFAEGSGTVTVTATVPGISYEIVIPADGAELSEDAHSNVTVGKDSNTVASVKNIKHASEGSSIFYTVSLGKFSDGNGNEMAASYTYTRGGADAELTESTRVIVYENGTITPSSIKVSISDEAWDNAASGTYTAGIVFRFDNESGSAQPGATFSDGTRLTWEELKEAVNGTQHGYSATGITDTDINTFALSCPSLTSITLPDSVTNICKFAFQGSTALTSITISGGVTTIGENAFQGCTALTSVRFQGTKAKWNVIEKGTDWNGNTGNYTIHCTDGDIAKGE